MAELPTLLSPEPNAAHPSYDTVRILASAWRHSGGAVVDAKRSPRLVRGVFHQQPRYTTLARAVIPMMGPRADWLPNERFLRQAEVHLLCWDVWPSNESAWARIFDAVRPKTIFMTSSDAAHAWAGRSVARVRWLPEATASTFFDPSLALIDRQVDVLEMGRRWGWLHDELTAPLANAGKRHLYQRSETSVVFKTTHSFRQGLTNSRTVICVPGSVSHPEKCAPYSTVTQRYLETMASGAVPVGIAPVELRMMGGRGVVVEIDQEHPARHILDILDHIDDYSDLVYENLRGVQTWGSWDRRLEELAEAIE